MYEIITVLLSFYPENLDKSLGILIKLNSCFEGRKLIIVVNNNGPLKELRKTEDIVQIEGDNRFWEFSGWDKAIEYISQRNIITDDSKIVFANDTIGAHRFFTLLDIIAYYKAIKVMPKNMPCMIGELNTFNENFSIDSIQADSWISTYLFAVNTKFLQNIRRTVSVENFGIELIRSEKNINGIFNLIGVEVSKNLLYHINNWLFPKKKYYGWYGAEKIRLGDDILLYGKLRSILNEKKLSAICVNSDGILIDVYSGKIISLYLKYKEIIYRNIYSRLIKFKFK